MKKMTGILALTFLASFANAESVNVTDAGQIKNLREAAKIAMSNVDKFTCTNQKTGEVETDSSSSLVPRIDSAGSVSKSESDQPVLIFAERRTNSSTSYFEIYSNAEQTQITSVKVVYTVLTDDKTVNLGTLTEPNLQIVKGEWKTDVVWDCQVKSMTK